MAAPTLSVYEYMFKDNGVKLNGPISSTTSGIDVEKISGLDMPEVIQNASDLDGMHGGFVSAAFVGPRTIIIDGMIYSPVNSIDTYIDTLVKNYMPSNTEYPFWYRDTYALRYIMAKSLGVKYDIENLRSSGRSSVQIQLICENPIKRVDLANTVISAVNTPVTITNAGNVATWQTITIPGPFTSIRLTNVTTGQILNLALNVASGSTVVIDTRYRSVRVDGVQRSGAIEGSWWKLEPGANQFTLLDRQGGTPSVTIASYSGWL